MPSSALSELDLDAVTMPPQPRAPFYYKGKIVCDWAQTTDDATLFLALAGAVHARALSVSIRPKELLVGLRSGATLLAGSLGGEADPAECEWVVESGELIITLRKAYQREWLQPLSTVAPPRYGE